MEFFAQDKLPEYQDRVYRPMALLPLAQAVQDSWQLRLLPAAPGPGVESSIYVHKSFESSYLIGPSSNRDLSLAEAFIEDLTSAPSVSIFLLQLLFKNLPLISSF